MNPFQKAIMWDRYSTKELDRDPQQGDYVIASINGRRSAGQITSGDLESLPPQYKVSFLSGEEDETLYRDDFDIVDEVDPDQIWRRVSNAAANNTLESELFYDAMKDWKFVPAGRILANMGTNAIESYYNCFVIPSPKDSRKGILNTLGQMVEIMSRGGGVGINLSSLRPKNARVYGVAGRSSGSVSWGKIYADTVNLISQGGSRRGALMLMLDVSHPDIYDFITAKKTAGQYTGCNMSVVISSEFMTAVMKDEDWDLVFPTTNVPEYKKWKGDLSTYKGPLTTYKTVKARELWELIMETAWASGEPGLWFKDRANEYSASKSKLIATNPCGEQGLPPWGVCNLGAINLGLFVTEEGSVDWDGLGRVTDAAVRFLDNVIDKNVYTYKQNEKQQKAERRVGLNFMGLADMMVKLRVRYGSDQAADLIDQVFSYVRDTAYLTSNALAQEKGSYPEFDYKKWIKSAFAQSLPNYICDAIKWNGLRNVTLLTCAPTGTTGTMVGASTGIEPYFALEWTRNSRLGSFTERVSTLEGFDPSNLPDYFVTAQELSPLEHVVMQACIQKYVDASISKTINLPSTATVQDVANVYMMLYTSGCKGGTVYRDQSRDLQVLELKTEKAVGEQCPECKEMSLINEAGCATCSNCGYAVCNI